MIKIVTVIFLLFSCSLIAAQSSIGVQMPELSIDGYASDFEKHLDLDQSMASFSISSMSIEKARIASIMITPKVYDYHALGMFCKFDVQLDRGSKIPLRFRLGTVGGVDELERKGPTRYNY